MKHRTFSQILVELMVLNIGFLIVLSMNRIAYLMVLQNQITLKLLKGMF